ncbi:CapA family protein [Microlunatus ginsengisoli]|uniref:Capsule synthesis protein CapA domain-containing protein n=1 Tax=Microlunatus ginsengisoli TaxID=363863 RepID=A0ABP7A3J0_9ACTN
MNRRVAASLLALALGAAACGAEPVPARPTPAAPTPAASVGPTPTPGATPAPGAVTYRMPLALIVHATRPVADAPLAAARRVVAGGGERWSELGQTGGRMRVLTTDGRTAGEVLAAVRASDGVLGIVPADAVDATVRVLTVGGKHPLRDPSGYPLAVRSARPVPAVTTLTAVGDIMLGRRVAERHSDPNEPLRPFAGRLAAADVTVGNVESTLSRDGSPTQGGDSFAASPRILTGLKRSGFDVIQLANNHLGDYGDRALRRTLQRYADAGLPTVGAGRTLSQARQPVIVERDGIRIGFLATESIGETPAATATRAGTNRLNMPPRTGPLNRAALKRITADIAALDKRVDTVVVLSHWGTQYTHRPEPSQRRVAKAFADAGADLIIGGHPHWVQGMQQFGATPVVYSLGNFVFDMDFQTKTNEGVIAEAVLWDGRVKAVELVPYVIGGDFVPRPVGGGRARGILDDVWNSSRGPWADPG